MMMALKWNHETFCPSRAANTWDFTMVPDVPVPYLQPASLEQECNKINNATLAPLHSERPSYFERLLEMVCGT